MQRGTIRPRSPTDIGELERPKYKIKSESQSAANTSSSSSSNHPLHTHRSLISPLMGHQVNTNGAGTATNGSASGSTTNGHSSVVGAGAAPDANTVKPGALMYEDDHDWAAYQTTVEVDPEVVELAPVWYELSGKTKPSKGAAAAKRMPVDREEVVRLMLQGLRDMGYGETADSLEKESGYQLAISPVNDFQAAVYGGRWSEALQLLAQLGLSGANTPSSGPSSSGSSISSGKTKAVASGSGSHAEQAKFLIARQKYLEYLEAGQQKRALAVLRGELAHLAKDSATLHAVSGYMMCLDKEDLYERAVWDGAAGTSRRQLLERLQVFISPKIMLPPRRLATLLEQSRRQQQHGCVFHEDGIAPSLYVDHECSSGQFPSLTTHVLEGHIDEVWKLEWSPDGTMLASCGKDYTVIVWQLKLKPKDDGSSGLAISSLHHLQIEARRDELNSQGVDAIAWSPDGKTLVAGAYEKLSIWDVETGESRHVSDNLPHTDMISCIRWKPDGSEFLVSSLDCKLVFYDRFGTVKRQWNFNTLQINDFIYTPDARSIIAGTTSLKRVTVENKLKQSISALASSDGEGLPRDFGYGAMEHNLVTIRLDDKEITGWSHDLSSTVSSLCMSYDNKRVLVACGPVLQLWSLSPSLRYIRDFTGHVHHGRFLIQCDFAAAKDRFVMSGSEDGHVYVWQTATGQSTEVLMGHKGSVNAVAWNPKRTRRIFASCGDDKTIHIWQPLGGLEESELEGLGGLSTRDDQVHQEEDEAMALLQEGEDNMVL